MKVPVQLGAFPSPGKLKQQGINLAFANLLLSRNCNVVIANLSLRPEAEKLIAQYGGLQSSPRAVFVQTDVTSWAALTQMFEVALEEFGDFHIFVRERVYMNRIGRIFGIPRDPQKARMAWIQIAIICLIPTSRIQSGQLS